MQKKMAPGGYGRGLEGYTASRESVPGPKAPSGPNGAGGLQGYGLGDGPAKNAKATGSDTAGGRAGVADKSGSPKTDLRSGT